MHFARWAIVLACGCGGGLGRGEHVATLPEPAFISGDESGIYAVRDRLVRVNPDGSGTPVVLATAAFAAGPALLTDGAAIWPAGAYGTNWTGQIKSVPKAAGSATVLGSVASMQPPQLAWADGKLYALAMTPDPREDDIFSVPLSGGDLSKVRAATGFSFAVAAGRLYFTEVDGTTALLRSTLLDGTDLVTHFTGALPLTSLHAAAGQLIWTAWDAQYRMPLGGGPVETIGSLMGVQRMASDARGTVAVQWSCRETQDDSPPECTNTMYALPGQRALASYRVSGNEAFGESIWEIVLTDRDAYWVIGATELYRVRR